MRQVKALSFLLILVISLSTARAADKGTPATRSTQLRSAIAQRGSGAFSMIAPVNKTDAPLLVRMDRGQRIELSPFAGVCFTIRTYKVERTERLREDENGTPEYSTCQAGSNYRIRSADGSTSK